MTASADFELSSDGGSTYAASNVSLADANLLAYDAAGNYSIKARLTSTADVVAVLWEITTADDEHLASLPTLTSNADKTCTFSAPKQGGAWILRATVTDGSGTIRTNTLAVKVATSTGNEIIAVGEGTETGDAGWIRCVNDLARAPSSGTPYSSTPAAVGSSGKAGSSSDYARGDHVHAGVATIAQSGKSALTGAVTLSAGTNVTLTQAGQDISIAASGSSGGPAAAITWDTTQATDSAVGRYQTWAEVRTAANATDAPLTILLVGTPTTSGTTTDDWPHVTWYSNDGDLTLTFTEGVVVKHSRFDMSGQVTSTATTTTNLQYSDGTIVTMRGKFSAGTKGLIGLDGTGTINVRLADSAIVSTYAFHTAASCTVAIYAGAAEFEAGAVDHFEGTAGTVNVYRTNETIGEVETGTYSGTSNRYVPSTPEKIQGVTVAVGTPSAGKALVATSGTAAEWAAQTVGGRAVSTTAPNDGDALVYSGENFQWEPFALTDASSLNGITVSGTPVDGMVLRATSGSAAAWKTPDMLWSPVAFVEASAGSASTAVDITCGQEFEVYRNYYCDGIRFRWATNSGTPTCTVELWDDVGNVLKTATQAVSTTATTYEVTFGTPQDLTSYKAKKLVVSVWQQTGGRYYSMVTTSYVSDAAPMLIGRDVWSRGSIYGAAHIFPDTNTTAEVYGVEPILRLK